ncbi:hypothetical protein E2C01_047771 [Portunus trituberculatus]|uniref:Uncharacterized protein n=1 Tax=Portunus trituberculatus TaxID=210409 RepID=A0A5B7G9Q9_PORTR|nr:hypothetical protein [Portunus trituberculatus]
MIFCSSKDFTQRICDKGHLCGSRTVMHTLVESRRATASLPPHLSGMVLLPSGAPRLADDG